MGGVEVTAVRDLDNGMDTGRPEGRSHLPWHPGNLCITFTLDNVHTLTLRASGTEPKLKYYLEVGYCVLLSCAACCYVWSSAYQTSVDAHRNELACKTWPV